MPTNTELRQKVTELRQQHGISSADALVVLKREQCLAELARRIAKAAKLPQIPSIADVAAMYERVSRLANFLVLLVVNEHEFANHCCSEERHIRPYRLFLQQYQNRSLRGEQPSYLRCRINYPRILATGARALSSDDPHERGKLLSKIAFLFLRERTVFRLGTERRWIALPELRHRASELSVFYDLDSEAGRALLQSCQPDLFAADGTFDEEAYLTDLLEEGQGLAQMLGGVRTDPLDSVLLHSDLLFREETIFLRAEQEGRLDSQETRRRIAWATVQKVLKGTHHLSHEQLDGIIEVRTESLSRTWGIPKGEILQATFPESRPLPVRIAMYVIAALQQERTYLVRSFN